MIEVNPTHLIGGGILLIGIATFVTKLIANGNGKRSKIYKRIEQERKDADNKFISITLCNERSKNFDKKLNEIGADVKLILKNGNQ